MKMRPRRPGLVLLALGLLISTTGVARSAVLGHGSAGEVTVQQASRGPRIYAYYYTWWNKDHWHDKLGPNYPYERERLPLPATLEKGGCNAKSKYPENQLFDVPERHLWSQDNPRVIERDVRTAARAGLAGFLVNWHGTGEADQEVNDTGYTERLDATIKAVNEVNADGHNFKLWLNYKASSKHRSASFMANDLRFIEERYGNNAAWDHHFSGRIMLIWGGSRKYELWRLRETAEEFADTFFIIGDEDDDSWTAERGRYLDGNHYYWSSQNPYSNPHSFEQLEELAAKVRSSENADGSGKLWFAPLTAGYNSELLRDGSCVPRRGGETLRKLFQGNSRSEPDAWTFISWNEIAEGTHIVPLKRWGRYYLNALTELTRP